MITDRPNRHIYFMAIARLVASRSTCDRAYVGAVLVRDNRVLTTGYNGSPVGMPHCSEVGHLMRDGHCVRTVHAEQNALIQAAVHGISSKGAILYCTHFPCLLCCQLIVNARIFHIVYSESYRPDDAALQLLYLTQIGTTQVDSASVLQLFAAIGHQLS